MTVKQKQLLLAYLTDSEGNSYYDGEIDGIWGAQSEAATTAFQNDFGGIAVDGDCGSETEDALKYAVYFGMPEREAEEEEEPEEIEVPVDDVFAGIKYWTKEEFKCRCGEDHAPYCKGYPAEIDRNLLLAADEIRERLGSPAHSTSGLRCHQHNADQSNAAVDSRHLYGKALDFWVEGKTAAEILAVAETIPQIQYCYAIDNDCVHINT